MKTGYKPFSGYVLVEKIEADEQGNGLIYVDDKDKPNAKLGRVISLGDLHGDITTEQYEKLHLTVQDIINDQTFRHIQIGDIIVYKKYVDFNFTENGTEYIIIKLEDIIAIKENNE